MDVRTTDYPDNRAKRCLGRVCGLVNHLGFKRSDRGRDEFAATEIASASITDLLPVESDPIDVTVGGGGWTTSAATITALGEFLERYAMYWPREDAVKASYSELQESGRQVIDDEYLNAWRASDLEDARFCTFDRETSLEWVEGINLRSGDGVFLPTELVCFGSRDEDRYFPVSTSGTACGSSLAQAVVNALYEQVERDAIMRMWYERRVPTRLDVSARDDLETLRRTVASDRYRVELLELPTPTECFVTVAAVIGEDDRAPKFLLFAGAGLTRRSSIRAALSEAAEGLVQTKHRLAYGTGSGHGETVVPDPDQIYNFADNVDYYMQPTHFDEVAHLLEGDVRRVTDYERLPLRDPETELDAALEALTADIDASPIAVDLTPVEGRELGLYVAAVFVPELIEISFPGTPPLDHPRLENHRTDRGHPFP